MRYGALMTEQLTVPSAEEERLYALVGRLTEALALVSTRVPSERIGELPVWVGDLVMESLKVVKRAYEASEFDD